MWYYNIIAGIIQIMGAFCRKPITPKIVAQQDIFGDGQNGFQVRFMLIDYYVNN